MSKIKLEKIVLEVGEKKIELSLEEARDLKDILKDLLGDGTGGYPVYVPYTEPYRISPIWIYSNPYSVDGTITISATTNSS